MLGSADLEYSRQSIDKKVVIGRILRNKELADAFTLALEFRSACVVSRGGGTHPPVSDFWMWIARTGLVCAFRILSKGCSSQKPDLFRG